MKDKPTPDFKAALDTFNVMVINDLSGSEFSTICGVPVTTIRQALLIADKLMKEPSDAVIDAWWACEKYRFAQPKPAEYFKAMRDQLLEEITQ